jgi:hypothetical protein
VISCRECSVSLILSPLPRPSFLRASHESHLSSVHLLFIGTLHRF